MRLRKNIFFIILFLVSISAFSQEKKSSFILGISPYYGFIIKHSSKLEGLTHSNPYGLEITANWLMMDEKSWQYCFCYPRVGLSFLYTNFANYSFLGNSFALMPFVEPTINGENKISGFIRFGLGPTYLTNIYDSINNPDNIFYSTRISFIVHLALGINFRVNDKLNLRFSGSFNHTSNGGIKNPNLGINFPMAALGAEYNFNPIPYKNRKKDKSLKLLNYKNRIDLTLFGTGKTAIKGQDRYPVLGLAGSYSRVITRQQALSTAMEFTFDYADKEEIRREHFYGNISQKDYKYLSFLIGHELLLGRFNFYQQLGLYLYSPFKRRDMLYQRYGLSYNFYKNMFVGINLKAHLEVADFMDFRLGISL